MNAIRNIVSYSLIAVLCASEQSFATIAKFSLVPTTPSTLEVPANRTAIVQYTVTNQTKITRTLTVVPMVGISQQTDTAGLCSNPFTLASQASCLLNLVVNGSQLSTVSQGPKVCKTKTGTNLPDSLLCSQASDAFTLNLSVGSAIPATNQNVYVTNWTAQSISLCSANAASGLLENCNIAAINGLFLNPDAIAVNAALTYLYVANIGGGVSLCQLNSLGTISGCVSTGSGFNAPDGIALNAAGTRAYVSNANLTTVSNCEISPTTGALSSCTPTGTLAIGQSDLTLHPSLPILYVSNITTSGVTACAINAGTGDLTCGLTTLGFNQPEGVQLNPTGNVIYVSNKGDGTISYCPVANDGSITGASCATTSSGTFGGFGSLSFNSAGTLAYIPSSNTTVSICSVENNGDLTNCTDSGGTGFASPSGILVL